MPRSLPASESPTALARASASKTARPAAPAAPALSRRRALTLGLLGACLVGFGLPLGGCKKDAANANQIVIGQVASKTGDTATFGVSSDEGVQLALDEINAAGGVLGKPVVVKTEDDQSKPDEAKTATNKLITQQNVVALIGEIASSRSIAMAPDAQAAGVPMLSPGSTNPKVTEAGDCVFRACFIDPFQGEAMARFAMEKLGHKRLAILFPVNSDYGVGLRDFVTETVKKNGGQIVAVESYEEKKDKDFRSQLTKIKAANPEAFFMTGYYNEAGLVAKQAKELGLTVPMIGGDGWDSDVTLTVGGDAINGCYFTNHYAPDEDRPEVKAFVEAYKKKYNGKVPDAMAVLGYDAMKLMVDAIKRAGAAEPKKIREALAATKDFPGVAGKITMDANRNASKPIVVIKIEDGKFKYQTKIEPK
jgi:branched-chain amino acid transport system substrate-binding protein